MAGPTQALVSLHGAGRNDTYGAALLDVAQDHLLWLLDRVPFYRVLQPASHVAYAASTSGVVISSADTSHASASAAWAVRRAPRSLPLRPVR